MTGRNPSQGRASATCNGRTVSQDSGIGRGPLRCPERFRARRTLGPAPYSGAGSRAGPPARPSGSRPPWGVLSASPGERGLFVAREAGRSKFASRVLVGHPDPFLPSATRAEPVSPPIPGEICVRRHQLELLRRVRGDGQNGGPLVRLSACRLQPGDKEDSAGSRAFPRHGAAWTASHDIRLCAFADAPAWRASRIHSTATWA